MRLQVVVCLSLLLAGCGYHLAGQGRGAIPEDVHAVALIATSEDARQLLPVLRNKLLGSARDIVPVGPGEADTELRLQRIRETFTPIEFDASGVAVTYRLGLTGSLSLWRGDKAIWESGSIHTQGDVYVVGDPASTEALRARMRQDLQKKWVQEAWRALTSGF